MKGKLLLFLVSFFILNNSAWYIFFTACLAGKAGVFIYTISSLAAIGCLSVIVAYCVSTWDK